MDDYKILHCKFGDVLLDEDIFYRVHGTQKPRPYHKFKKISNIRIRHSVVRCNFAKSRNQINLSRLILQPKKHEIADHINRNPLDNQRNNLRIVNSRQNCLNRTSRNGTGFYGVNLDKKRKRCVARFNSNTKTYRFDVKDTERNRILCAFAHDKFVLQSGDEEYAPLNFPCWKFEPFKSILLKENLYEHKEK